MDVRLAVAEVLLESVDAALPEPLVEPDPRVRRSESFRSQRQPVVAARDAPLHQARLLQDFDVLRDGIERHVERPCDLRHLELAFGREAPDDGAAGTVGECAVDAVEGRNINHSVEYYPNRQRWANQGAVDGRLMAVPI